MAKIIIIAVLMFYLLLMYVACFVAPGLEHEWEQMGKALSSLERLFLNGSRFLAAWGIYIGAVLLAFIAYAFLTTDKDDA